MPLPETDMAVDRMIISVVVVNAKECLNVKGCEKTTETLIVNYVKCTLD